MRDIEKIEEDISAIKLYKDVSCIIQHLLNDEDYCSFCNKKYYCMPACYRRKIVGENWL